jgi:hypothetical protein
MKNGKIYLINLGVLFTYLVVIKVAYDSSAIIVSVLPILLQLIVNFMLGIITIGSDRPKGLAYILSIVVVLLIGFPSCLIISDL